MKIKTLIRRKKKSGKTENDEEGIVKLDNIVISRSLSSTTTCDSIQKTKDCGIELSIRSDKSNENQITVKKEKKNLLKIFSPKAAKNIAKSSSNASPKAAKNIDKSSSNASSGEMNENLSQVSSEKNPESSANSCKSSSIDSSSEIANEKTPKSIKDRSSSSDFFREMKANLPKVFGEKTPKSTKSSSTTSLRAFFAEMTPKSAKNRSNLSSNAYKMITVDEKEKLVDIVTTTRSSGNISVKSSGYFSKESSNGTQVTAVRSNVRRLANIGKKTQQQRGSHLRQTRWNVSAATKSKKNIRPIVTRGLKDFSSIIANDTPLQSSKTPKGFAKTPFNFTISLDSIEGITCINDGLKKTLKDRDKTVVVLSYFEPSNTGENIRRNIHSAPITADFSNGNSLYKANFVSERKQFTFPVAMSKDYQTESGYATHSLYLRVILKKGKESVTLGHALLPLNGDEEGTKRSIPIGNILITTSRACHTASVAQASKISTKGLKSFSFASDVKTKYILRNATIQVFSIKAEIDIDLNNMMIHPAIGECISNLSVNEEQFCSLSPAKDSRDQYTSAFRNLIGIEGEMNDEDDDDDDDDDSGIAADEGCKAFSCRNFGTTDEGSFNQTGGAMSEIRFSSSCLTDIMEDDNPMNNIDNNSGSEIDQGCKAFSCRDFGTTDEGSFNPTNEVMRKVRYDSSCLTDIMGDDNPMNTITRKIFSDSTDDDSDNSESDDDDDDSSDSSEMSSDDSEESTRN